MRVTDKDIKISGTNNTEPRAVTAHLGQHTRPTSSDRQPLPATSPVPEGLMVMQDHQAVFDYDPGILNDLKPSSNFF